MQIGFSISEFTRRDTPGTDALATLVTRLHSLCAFRTSWRMADTATLSSTPVARYGRSLGLVLLLSATIVPGLTLAFGVAPLGHFLVQGSTVFTSYMFWTTVLVGFLAQAVDGALGMAYGITSTTFLLSTGVPPAVASAAVHIAEIFTTGVSGLSHWRFGNVNRALFRSLLWPGILGGITGTYLLSHVDGKTIKPWIAAYLLLMGLRLLGKAWGRLQMRREAPRHVGWLALFGGFIDAIGGGGWGPVVTTSLLGTGHTPHTTIGSVNAAEFFLTLVSGMSFAALVGVTSWEVIAGLMFGGIFAAPFAAWVCRKLPASTLLMVVGIVITCLSLFNIYRTFA